MSENQRNRGRMLTPAGLHKLQQAIRAWEIQHGMKCTQEKIRELSDAFKEGGLDPGTIRKILEAKESVDRKSIQYLFQTFGLQLDEVDWMTAAQGKLQSDPNFVGRDGAIADLNTLVSRDNKVIVIQARGGVGKTTLARKYLQQTFDAYLEFPIAKETKDIASIESLIEEKLRQLGEEPGREFFVSLDRLKRKLQAERIGILIDNLEPALDAAGKLIEPHRRYVELLRVLADPSVQAVTLITSRERLNEYSISMQHYLLSELSLSAWTQFFQNRLALFASDRPVSATDDAALAALHKAYGGNAKAMDILCGAVLTDYSGKLAAYWQANQDDLLIERALEDLVVGQFDRLQTLDPDAYKLLCRLGCYRYQDVPTVPITGLLCLLWDVPENRQKRVVKALQDRSLVEFAEGEYWLHPVIRGEAIDRLRNSEDWEITNQKAAEFWTETATTVETVKDAIKAFEAYYQYLEIRDFEQAGTIIFKSRNIKFVERSDLGRFLSRVGLMQLVINSVNSLLSNIKSEYHLSRLHDLIAVSHRMMGNVHQAIKYHEKVIEAIKKNSIASKSLDGFISYEDEGWLEVNNLMNMGLCKIELLEFAEAQSIFSDLKQTLPERSHYSPIIEACFIFLTSCISPAEISSESIHYIYINFFGTTQEESGRGFRLVFLGMAYRNLGEYDSSLKMYRESIEHSEKLKYQVTQAVALTCIGEIYRAKKEFELAIEFHLSSIESLTKVGVVCDLAKAHYQLGLTYQAMGEVEKGDESFQEAIRLFSEMEAPKQVERVRRSMGNIE